MKLNLIYGGKSPEHEISVLTAMSVQKKLNYDKYVVQPIYITKQGQWLRGEVLEAPLSEDTNLYLEAADHAAFRAESEGTSFGEAVVPSDVLAEGTVAFPLLHGPNGEDGTIQGLFETLDVPYVGCGVLASAAGMDKVTSKYLFREAQIPQVPFVSLTRYQWEHDREQAISRIEGQLVYPLFVKPSNMGSSVGISVVNNRDELADGIEEALQFDRRLLIEQGVDAREIELAVMGNDDVQVSVPGELVKEQAFYDYDAKYVDDSVKLQIPAELPEDMVAQLQDYAERAYRVLDGSGLARCDFFVTKNNAIYINEVNTLPGFTTISMFPMLWEATGKTYAGILDELIELAIERYNTYHALSFDGGQHA
ncbi:MAG: D-alanine--D-alanine ligase [Aerococcus sp.]|nr:D-alanine--D-alanine ligase [Aerococcus sp.]